MGRRKKVMDDGYDSSEDEDGRINFDNDEMDAEDDMEGFAGFRQKKPIKRKRFGEEDEEDQDDLDRPSMGLGAASAGLMFQQASAMSASSSPAATPKSNEPSSRSSTPSFIKPTADFAKFNRYTKGFGQKMLERMGWKQGSGLGSSGEGIVNPVETKQRPARMGMGFRGFSERTEQARQEARRRGETVSDESASGEEEEQENDQGARVAAKQGAWKHDGGQRRRKPKVVYKTAKQVLADVMEVDVPAPTQKVIDMTGPDIRKISLADIRPSDSPTLLESTMRLPELRHNLRLIVDLSRGDLEHLCREKQTSVRRITELGEESAKVKTRLATDQGQLVKVQQVKVMAQDLKQALASAQETGAIDNGNITALFGHVFGRLETEYSDDIQTLHLDALVVSVWEPVWRHKFRTWDVLSEPSWGVEAVRRWHKLLQTNDDNNLTSGRRRAHPKSLVATPFETMMNTTWLMPVRSAINNTWDVRNPEPLIQLLEEWQPLLPRFIFENILEQLLLPKLTQAVAAWDPRKDPDMIHTWIHPWLPVVQAWRLSDVLASIRHKLSVVLRQWHPSDESAYHIIRPWKDVWTAAQMETFLVRTILPKLTLVLRDEFKVNPRQQVMEPLTWCLIWTNMLSQTIVGQLFENEFFPKWLDVLRKWLRLDRESINYNQVAEWYAWWKQVLGSYDLLEIDIVKSSLRKALEMMHQATIQA